MLTMAILLPSGICECAWNVRVETVGTMLEVEVTWPPAMIDMEILHTKWLDNASLSSDNGSFTKFHT